jgi:competence protein ComEA
MKEETSLSGKLTLALAALLCLLFGLSLLLFLPGASPEPEIRAAEVLPERTLTGGDEADRLPTELLPGEKLDLNSATAAQLQRLPGIGEKLSASIVAWREEHGPFRSVEELLQIPGIGEKRLAEIRGLVTAG